MRLWCRTMRFSKCMSSSNKCNNFIIIHAILPNVSLISLAANNGSAISIWTLWISYKLNPFELAPSGFSNSLFELYLLFASHSFQSPNKYLLQVPKYLPSSTKTESFETHDSSATFPTSINNSAHEFFSIFF